MRYRGSPDWAYHNRGNTLGLTREQVRSAFKRVPNTPAGKDLKERWFHRNGQGSWGPLADYWDFLDRGEKVKPEDRYWLVVGVSWVKHCYSLESCKATVERLKELQQLIESW